jgi:pantetheine-phosphate adenylyltransferase
MPHEVKAVYTGSFDPVTLGHLDIIRRASHLFAHVVVGIGINKDKHPLFDPDQRVDLVRRLTADVDGIEVATFDGLAVDFVRKVKASVMVRGIRPLTDIAGEFTMMMANGRRTVRSHQQFLAQTDRRDERRRRPFGQVRAARDHRRRPQTARQGTLGERRLPPIPISCTQ